MVPVIKITKDEVLGRLARSQPVRRPGMFPSIADIDLQKHEFAHYVDFGETVFCGNANFRGTVFAKGANFRGCKFENRADFSWSQFTGPAYFWRTHFLDVADFSHLIVNDAGVDRPPNLDPGVADFSWAYFGKQADFNDARFLGSAFFWRTVFDGPVDFDQAKFKAGATFNGTSQEVRLSLLDPSIEDLLRTLTR